MPEAQPVEAPPAPAAPVEGQIAEQAPAPTEEAPEKPDKSRRFERRIDAANRKYGQEKARADQLAAEVERLKPKPVVAPGAPKLEDFNDIEAFADAKAEFVAEQRLKDYQSKQQQERQQQTGQRLKAEWEAKTEDAEAKWEDFNEVVGVIEPTTPLTAALMRADPSVAYHLGKHPSEAKALAALDPVDQLVALGRLAAKLESAPPVAKQPSKAPAPINPVQGKAPAVSEDLSPEDDMATFIRKRNKQLGRK